MRTKGIIGKRIVSIEQRQFVDQTMGRLVNIESITLEGGIVLRPYVSETADGAWYAVDIVVKKPEKKPGLRRPQTNGE